MCKGMLLIETHTTVHADPEVRRAQAPNAAQSRALANTGDDVPTSTTVNAGTGLTVKNGSALSTPGAGADPLPQQAPKAHLVERGEVLTPRVRGRASARCAKKGKHFRLSLKTHYGNILIPVHFIPHTR